MMPVHERVDLTRWLAAFPLDRHREKARQFVRERAVKNPSLYANESAMERHVALMGPGGQIITSPFDIAEVEALRAEVFATKPPLRRVPTDVFVFARGEPKRREVTKVGGLPFRSARKPWPRAPSGKPLTFIAQFCFADSRDLAPTTPGDLLLVFGDYEQSRCTDEGALRFEWVWLDEPAPLVAREEMPGMDERIVPAYGAIHRTFDYPDDELRFEASKQGSLIAVIEGTKIGGTPRWIQADENPGGTFLCVLGSMQPAPDEPYPFLNVPEPIPLNKLYDPPYLAWGDMGSVYFFLDANEIRWVLQCY